MLLRENFSCRMSEIGFAETGSEATLAKAEKLVREAAAKGANIVLLQELIETPYFCQRHDFEYMDLATTPEENPAVKRFQEVAKELDIVIPVSFFERAGNAAFNSVVIIDADGCLPVLL